MNNLTANKRANEHLTDLLVARNWNHDDLAVAIGMSKVSVAMTACGYQLNRPCRRRIEKLFREPLWSSQEEWDAANRAEKILGLDPIAMPQPEVRLRAVELGIISPGSKASAEAIVACVAKLPDDYQPPAGIVLTPEPAQAAPVQQRLFTSLGHTGLAKFMHDLRTAPPLIPTAAFSTPPSKPATRRKKRKSTASKSKS